MIKFDIVEFYASISDELLNRPISFARSITTIIDSFINIIHHSRKSLLFGKTSARVKKGNNFLFDFTMGPYNGAEICELVGLYLLNRLSTVIDKISVGLCRDDGLAAISNTNGPKLDRNRKDIIAYYSRKKDFQSQSKQILSKQVFKILPSTLWQRNTFLFERPTIHNPTSTPFLTTHLQLSNSCLK